jgi:hypothetical protein
MRICRREKGAAPWRDAKFFSLALGLTAALAWPVRALAQASDQAPPKPENVLRAIDEADPQARPNSLDGDRAAR